MDSEIIRAYENEPSDEHSSKTKKIDDDIIGEVIKPIENEFTDPIVAPHWWKKPALDLKTFRTKTRINNTIWRQWYVHFILGRETMIQFANPLLLADKYHARTLAVVVEGHYWCRKQRAIRIQYSSWRKTNQRQARMKPKPIKKKRKLVQSDLSSPIDSIEKSISGMFHDIVNDDGNLQNFFSTLTPYDFPLNFDEDLLFPSHGCQPSLTTLQPSCQFDDLIPDSAFPLSLVQPQNQTYQIDMSQPQSNDMNNLISHRPDTSSLVTLANCASTDSEYYQQNELHHMNHSRHMNEPQQIINQHQTRAYQNRRQDYLTVDESAVRHQDNIDVTSMAVHSNEQPHSSKNGHYPYGVPRVELSKSQAYYPPTTLQQCYSNNETKHSFNGKIMTSFAEEQEEEQAHATEHKKSGTGYRDADRKRRRKMKDQLFLLRDALPDNIITKKSNALILSGAADYIAAQERKIKELESNISQLNCSIDRTNSTILNYQKDIPENGLTSACYRDPVLETQYNAFVEQQIAINPQFSIFSSFISPIFDYYNSMVNTETLDKFCQSVNVWFTQHCSLNNVRQLAVKLVTRSDLGP